MALLQPAPEWRAVIFYADAMRPGVVWREADEEEVVPPDGLARLKTDPNVQVIIIQSAAPVIWVSPLPDGYRVNVVLGGEAPVKAGDIITADRRAELESAHYEVRQK